MSFSRDKSNFGEANEGENLKKMQKHQGEQKKYMDIYIYVIFNEQAKGTYLENSFHKKREKI